MSILLFVLWLVLNGHFAWDIAMLEIVLFGLALCTVIYLFLLRFTKWDLQFELFVLRNFHLFIAYFAVLLWSVVVSNFQVIGIILGPHESPKPIIVSFNVPLRREMLRSLLANSITLTPGTITISSTPDCFTVHCLKKDFIDGFEHCALVRILEKMEEHDRVN